MKKDPIIEVIRRIREAHSAKYDYDLKDKEKTCGHTVVSFTPKRHLKAMGS